MKMILGHELRKWVRALHFRYPSSEGRLLSASHTWPCHMPPACATNTWPYLVTGNPRPSSTPMPHMRVSFKESQHIRSNIRTNTQLRVCAQIQQPTKTGEVGQREGTGARHVSEKPQQVATRVGENGTNHIQALGGVSSDLVCAVEEQTRHERRVVISADSRAGQNHLGQEQCEKCCYA